MERAEVRIECLKVAAEKIHKLGEPLIAEAKVLEQWVLGQDADDHEVVNGAARRGRPKKSVDNVDPLS